MSGGRTRQLFGHRHVPIAAAWLAFVLCAPALWLGFQIDDHFLRFVLSDPPLDPEWTRSPVDVFRFVSGDEAQNREAIAATRLPWWAHPRLQLAFLRPVSSLTHWFDFNAWPDRPWLMHLQSLVWLAGAVFAAAALYRRLLLPAWVAGLAALLFAVDDAHGMPAVWLANRNASIGVFFGLLALVAHDRWRRDGWRPGSFLAPLALLAGLLAGEIALAATAYLAAYACFLDRGRWPSRLGSLVPAALAGVAWWAAYRLLGYGAEGSGVYIDPVASPGAFAGAAAERLPMLFFGQWALPSSLSLMLSRDGRTILWIMTVVFMALVIWLLMPLLERQPAARFFAAGMMLSFLPACATFPDDRLLYFAGFGGMGLLASWLAAVRLGDESMRASRARRLALRPAWVILVLVHLVVSPLALATTAAKMNVFADFMNRAAGSLPSDRAVTDDYILVVNAPSAFVSGHALLMQSTGGRPTPRGTLTLGSGMYPIEISRPGARVITVRPEGGFLAQPGSPRPGHEDEQPAFHPLYFHQMLDRLYRDATPFHVRERIEYGCCIVEIASVTEDGRPAEVAFHFNLDLENSSLRWLQWKDSAYAPIEIPAIGETQVLPAVTFP